MIFMLTKASSSRYSSYVISFATMLLPQFGQKLSGTSPSRKIYPQRLHIYSSGILTLFPPRLTEVLAYMSGLCTNDTTGSMPAKILFM